MDFSESLNYMKQLGLKEDLGLSRGFSMETLCPHEYDILVVRKDHLEGPHVFGFLIHALPSPLRYGPKRKGHPCMEK